MSEYYEQDEQAEDQLADILSIIGLGRNSAIKEVQIKVWWEDEVQTISATYNSFSDSYDVNLRESKYPTGVTY